MSHGPEPRVVASWWFFLSKGMRWQEKIENVLICNCLESAHSDRYKITLSCCVWCEKRLGDHSLAKNNHYRGGTSPFFSGPSRARTSLSFLIFFIEPFGAWVKLPMNPNLGAFLLCLTQQTTIWRFCKVSANNWHLLAHEPGSEPEKSSAELLKNRPGSAQALALFYASPTFRPGPSSPSLGSFHL